MEYGSRHLEALIKEISKLPGIGTKTAQRLAFHLLRAPKEEALALAKAIERVRTEVTVCKECGNFADGELCGICLSPKRDRSLLCVVEQPSDIILIEKTGRYDGLYHVLRGALEPAEGVGAGEVRLEPLLERVRSGSFTEVIVATNPTTPGEATAYAIAELLKSTGVRVTRIARGVPMGSDLEFADMATLSRALEGRKSLD